MKPVINVGIIGFGVVGCGVYDIFQRNARAIELRVGSKLVVKRVADTDPDRPRPIEFDRSILTTNPEEIINDPEIDIVAELIGGVDPAQDYIMAAIRNGKHVVTANKELLAKSGHSLLVEAGERKQDFYFETSVGGGIPIINPMKTSLAGNHIREIKGIVNGTTNYILTRMAEEEKDFEEVLTEAQALGYAERDPTNDVDGHDAAYKIAILASIGFMSRVDVSEVYREGIRNITQKDIAYAKELGYKIKLLAIAKEIDGQMQVRVHPAMIPVNHPLASVSHVYNAIYINADPVGNLMFYGRGAGAEAAGSAVVGDIIDVARNINTGSTGRISCTCFEEKVLQSMDEVQCKHYIRMKTTDKPGVLSAISTVFGANNVSITAVLAKSTGEPGSAESIWVTHTAPEPSVRLSLEAISALPVVTEVSNWIRVEE
ncbi:MAG TPA: homoserine dehydrogenase [Armatimonadota bacterium]|nr:homoserine dehydrogenase [Armatimonadota bacterium]